MAEAVYLNGVFIKSGKFGLKVSVNVDKFIEELQKHRNAKGYVNFDINPRKEADKNGNTHFAKLDTWQPNSEPAQIKPAYQQPSKQDDFINQPNGFEKSLDLPF